MKHSKEKSAHGRRFWLVVLSVVGILSLVAMSCGGSSKSSTPTPAAKTPAGTTAAVSTTSAGAKGQVKIGFLGDYTGDLAEFGPNMEHGAQLAVKELNDAGGVLGQNVVLKTADTQTSPTVGVDAARQLVEGQGVQALIGALSSGVTLAVAQSVAVPDKVIQISPASTAVSIALVQDDDLLFRTTLSDAGQGLILGQLAKSLGYNKVATLYVNNAYGQGLSDSFAKSFEAQGGTITAQVSTEQEQPTYLSELQAATKDNPDAVAALTYPQSAEVYLKEGFDNNLLKNVLFCDGTQSLDVVKAVGADKLEGMEGTVAAAAQIPADWQSEFEANYGALPHLPYIPESYDAVMMVALGAEKAQSTDPIKIRDAMRTLNDPNGTKVTSGAAGIKQALDLIHQGKPINYQGASGFSGWDKNGDVLSGYIQTWKYSGGQIVTVTTQPVTVQSVQ